MKKNKKIKVLLTLSVSLFCCIELHSSATLQLFEEVQEKENDLNQQRVLTRVRTKLIKCSPNVVERGVILPTIKAAETMPSTREETVSYVLRYLFEKSGDTPKSSRAISDEIALANVLMGETYFVTVRRKYDEEVLTSIFEELLDKTATCKPLKDFWPRIITMLSMNKMAHTPFFLPNKFTMIMKPFSPKLISFIDRELERTQSNKVNAILYWMRSNYYVKWVPDMPRAWDVHCASRRVAIVDGEWTYEDFDPRREALGKSAGAFDHYLSSSHNIPSVVCNRHFPQETAKLFQHRTEKELDKDSDFLVDILMAKYLSWLAKAEHNGKKYMSFYEGGEKSDTTHSGAAENATGSVAPIFHPHKRIQDLSGPFPGMQVYQHLILSGFDQPSDLYVTKKLPYTQEELSYQGCRYYVDAASKGLGTAIDYLRKRYSDYYAEHFIPIELEIADKKRAEIALWSLNWVRQHKVDEAHISRLREIAEGGDIKPCKPTQEGLLMQPPSPHKTPVKNPEESQSAHNRSMMPPPSPRKTPVKNLEQSQNVQSSAMMPPPSPRKTPVKKPEQSQNAHNNALMPPASPRRILDTVLLRCDEEPLEIKALETREEKKERNVFGNVIYQ